MSYILCAAIHYQDPAQFPSQPDNIETGFVIGGWRHSHCLNTLWALRPHNSRRRIKIVQGFLTSDNRFVDRTEAFHIAKAANQIKGPRCETEKDPILISEDLY